jgi:hypothetical protein
LLLLLPVFFECRLSLIRLSVCAWQLGTEESATDCSTYLFASTTKT